MESNDKYSIELDESIVRKKKDKKRKKEKEKEKQKERKQKAMKLDTDSDISDSNTRNISNEDIITAPVIQEEDITESSEEDLNDGSKYLLDDIEIEADGEDIEEDSDTENERAENATIGQDIEEAESIDEDDQKEKKVNTTIIVIGYVYGICENTLKPYSNFRVEKVITKRKKIPRNFPILKLNALPTYCPWILYTILVQPPIPPNANMHGPNTNVESHYTILEVLECNYRILKKTDLKKYIIKQHSSPNIDEKIFSRNISKALINVPKIITNEAALCTITDTRISSLVNSITKPRFGGLYVLSLLAYFSYTFLAQFDTKQLIAILSMVIDIPYVFCFWDKFISTALALRYNSKPIFVNTRGELDIDDGYIRKTIDKILQSVQKKVVVIYDSNYPNWSVSTFRKAIRDYKKYDPESIDYETITVALLFNLKYHERKMYLRNSILNINAIREDMHSIFAVISTVDTYEKRIGVAIEYLKEQRILISLRDLYDGFITKDLAEQKISQPNYDVILTDPHTGLLEFELIYLLKQKKCVMKLYTTNEYATEYIEGFKTLMKSDILNSGKLSRTIFLSSNKVCSRYMQSETGFKFEPINQYILQQKRRNKKSLSNDKIPSKNQIIEYIIVDRIHKCSLLELTELLRLVDNRVVIYLFGDLEEYGPNYRKGTHHLLFELQGFNISRLPTKPATLSIARIRSDIQNGKLNGKYCEGLFKPKDLAELIKNIETTENATTKKFSMEAQANEEKCNRSHQLLCTTEADKVMVMTILFKKLNRDYKRGEYQLGDKVHIQEDDTIGRLEKVWKVDAYGNQKSMIKNPKEKINLFRGSYQFSLYHDTHIYSTSKNTVEHADIISLSKFAGAPSDYIISLVGKTTTYNDINIATKYARKDFKLMLLPEANISQVLSKRGDIFYWRFNNNLAEVSRILTRKLGQ